MLAAADEVRRQLHQFGGANLQHAHEFAEDLSFA
jgi:hypothetical protein